MLVEAVVSVNADRKRAQSVCTRFYKIVGQFVFVEIETISNTQSILYYLNLDQCSFYTMANYKVN